jgi:putative protease
MEIGVVTHYFDKINVAAILLSKPLKVGDKIQIKSHEGMTDFEQVVESMQINREDVKKAKSGDEIGIKVKQEVNKRYKVYKT